MFNVRSHFTNAKINRFCHLASFSVFPFNWQMNFQAKCCFHGFYSDMNATCVDANTVLLQSSPHVSQQICYKQKHFCFVSFQRHLPVEMSLICKQRLALCAPIRILTMICMLRKEEPQFDALWAQRRSFFLLTYIIIRLLR